MKSIIVLGDAQLSAIGYREDELALAAIDGCVLWLEADQRTYNTETYRWFDRAGNKWNNPRLTSESPTIVNKFITTNANNNTNGHTITVPELVGDSVSITLVTKYKNSAIASIPLDSAQGTNALKLGVNTTAALTLWNSNLSVIRMRYSGEAAKLAPNTPYITTVTVSKTNGLKMYFNNKLVVENTTDLNGFDSQELKTPSVNADYGHILVHNAELADVDVFKIHTALMKYYGIL